ncbi:PucR family transcriptional regulator [Streptomyces violaceusniger]|uniref:PucR family transcriptional regulator n=1 Tax=Streptomyces violaceusniger TaxID=68280 RepID=UPI0031E1B569
MSKLGVGPVCWAIEQGRATAAHIVEEVPLFEGGGPGVEVLSRGSEAATLHSLLRLAEPSAEFPSIGDEPLGGIPDYVHRGVPLHRVLAAIRVGHASLARAFLRACERLAEPDRLTHEMKAVNDELFAYVDAFTDEMTQTYLAEHDRWTTSAAAARVETVHALLADTVVDVDAAARMLGYDLQGTHVGVIVWADTPAEEARLQSTAVILLTRWGATATLVVPVGSGRVWAWGTVPRRWREQAIASGMGAGLRAAVGTPASGLQGFRRTHQEALRVERLRGLSVRKSPRVTLYRDVVLTVLLAGDLVAAGEFVRSELGELGGRGEAMQVLRTTLLHYFKAERSLVRAAEQLHVARGTVAYRVKRAQEVIGRDVGDRRFPLYAALLLAEELGNTVLEPAPSTT